MKNLSCAFFSLAVISTAILVPDDVVADVGNNNPTGTSGQYNGNVTTGCSYDPYTANATRSVTDIVVPGAVGAYPLAFTRTMTSRYTVGSSSAPAFGQPGTWRHNYQWSIDEAILYNQRNPNAPPTNYAVNYPDGRRVIFGTANRNGDPYFEGPPGVRDRFEGVSGNNCYLCNCYLHLPDGGKIWFQGSSSSSGPDGGPYTVYWTFTLMGIIDPYLQTTTISYPSDYSMTVTEPAGRMLKIFWSNVTGATAVNRVEQWVGSTMINRVSYHYTTQNFGGTNYSALTSVSYPDGTSASYTYQNSNIASNGRPLIRTCVDPMFVGPMWKIAYVFQPNGNGVAYGQLNGEEYFDGTRVSSNYITGTAAREEIRGDEQSRTFNYSSYQLTSATDFKGYGASKAYDQYGFVNSARDRNGNLTTFANDPWTGNVNVTYYPLTPSDNGNQATSQVVYEGTGCNQDVNNPYYPCGYTNAPRRGRKRGFSATYQRDTNKRVTQINYPDGGFETFSYNSFGQVLTHRLKVGGLETFTYDTGGRGLLTEYRDAYHLATGDPQNPDSLTSSTPTLAYAYYTSGPNMDRISTITDGRGNTTSFTYNNRGQVLTVTPPGAANPVTNVYDPSGKGTLVSVTNELLKTTSYTYDDYKRVTSVTLPPPTPGPSPAPTTYSYDHTGGTSDDYTHTNPNPTRVTLPSGKIAKTVYDPDFLTSFATVGYGTNYAATTSFTYDNNGNRKKVTDPNGQSTGLYTQYFYDAQNRLTDMDDPMVNDGNTPHQNSRGHTVSYTYDQASNKLTELRTNNQLISYQYDPNSMNLLTQINAPQDPSPTAVTKYVYYTTGRSSGLLHTMQDPHLVGGQYSYSYGYDLMGRKTSLTYPPPDSNGASSAESWSYDAAGNIGTFTNRNGKTQTFSYDARNRPTGFTWNDGATSWQTIFYGDGLHVTEIDNHDAVIKNTYFDDNTLQSQEEWATDAPSYRRTVGYTYEADLNRYTMSYPNSDNFQYFYTGRNQVASILDTTANISPVVYNIYDANGNVTGSSIGQVVTNYPISFNPMNRCTHISISFADLQNEGARTFDYVYDQMNNRTSIQEDGGTPKTYAYDLAEQSTTETGSPTFTYDANGNRTGGTFGVNNLNEYTTFNGSGATYDTNGNLTAYNGWAYVYDAQNRMTSASQGATSETFKYDGLNRQISRTLNGVTTYNVWDGWNLIEEYTGSLTVPFNVYVYGAFGEIVERLSGSGTILYLQDAMGSTSYISDASGNPLESYTYSRTGTPSFHSGDPTLPDSGGSLHDIRHLFHGRLWTQETGLNDYRNRMQLPTMGVFMQTDPIGFAGDPTNLYRFCGNNAFNRRDTWGLDDQVATDEEDKGVGQANLDGLEIVTFDDGTSEFVNPDRQVEQVASDSQEIIGGQTGGTGTDAVPYDAQTGLGGAGDTNASLGNGDVNGSPGGSDISSGPGSISGVGVEVSNGLNQSQGSLYDYSWLGHQIGAANNGRRADIASGLKFANAVDKFALYYTVGTLGPAGAYAGGLAVFEGGSLAGSLGEAAFYSAVSHPATISAVAYGISTFNNSVRPEEQLLLPEIIEFEIREISPWLTGH